MCPGVCVLDKRLSIKAHALVRHRLPLDCLSSILLSSLSDIPARLLTWSPVFLTGLMLLTTATAEHLSAAFLSPTMPRCFRKLGDLVESQVVPKYEAEDYDEDHRDDKQRLNSPQPQRHNKLTKPRTNTNSASTSSSSSKCFLPFSIASARLSTILSSSKSKTLPHDDAASRRSATLAYRPGCRVVDRADISLPVRAGSNSLPVREGSNSTRVSDRIGNSQVSPSLDSIITDISAPLRRRSTLRAPPPATISRLPASVSRPVPEFAFDENDPAFAPLDALDLAVAFDRQGCLTPSGYSVLGGFKRGSLRITNGNASPAPSSNPGSPRLGPDYGFGQTKTPSPQVSKSACEKCNISHPNLRHDTLLAPEPPCFKCSPRRPFSFTQSPKPTLSWHHNHDVYDEELDESPLEESFFPVEVVPPLFKSTRFRNIPETLESKNNCTTQIITPESIFDEITRLQEDDTSSFRRPTPLQEFYTNDSGYSSTGSNVSFKTAKSRPGPKSDSTRCYSVDSGENRVDRGLTIAALEGGIFGSAAGIRESMPRSCMVDSRGNRVEDRLAPLMGDTQRMVVGHHRSASDSSRPPVPPVPPKSIYRKSYSYVCGMEGGFGMVVGDGENGVGIPDNITGQAYYQRFLRRRP